MLYAVDQNDLVVFKDLMDDAVVAPSRRPKTLEFSNQRPAEPIRIVRNRPEDRLQCSVPYVLRKSIEMTETLSRYLDLVHPATSDVILETQPLAILSVFARPSK